LTAAGLVDAAHGEAATSETWGRALSTAALAIDAGDAAVAGTATTVPGVIRCIDALPATLGLSVPAPLFGAFTGAAVEGPPPPAGGDARPLALDGAVRARLTGSLRRHFPPARPAPAVPL
jgi:hypothetical protein